MYREGHLAHDDERTDQAGDERQQRGRQQGLLDEVAAEQVGGDVEGEQMCQQIGEPCTFTTWMSAR